MAYTYNDVQNSGTVFASEDAESTTKEEGGLDLERWLALQEQFMASAADRSSDLGTDSLISATEQNTIDVLNLGEAKRQFTLAQAIENVHIGSDNFIRDSITGK
jgi:hypothetical protein